MALVALSIISFAIAYVAFLRHCLISLVPVRHTSILINRPSTFQETEP